MKSREFKALKLRLSLNIEDADMDMLKKYGKVKDGIIRDIIVPANMTLHALHYAIQKAFGWQNSHLHHFELSNKCFSELTQGMFMNWADYCGLYFRFPNDDLEDLYWDDDYNESVSVKTWLKRKYTGIYQYHGISEHFMEAKDALYSFMNENQTVKVTPPFGEWMRMSEVEKKKLEKHPRIKKIEDVTLSEFRDFFMESGGPEELLERLTLKELLGEKADDEILRTLTRDAEARYKANSTSADNEYEYWHKMTRLDGKVLPLTKELLYKYDSGDDWEVKIELLDDYYSDDAWDHPNKAGFIHTPVTDEQFFDDQTPMNRNGEIIEGELRDQIATVITQMKPRCVAIDGLPVLDDVGGIGGYCEMLGGIHGIPSEHYDYTDPEETKEWARMLGWTGRMNKPETVL